MCAECGKPFLRKSRRSFTSFNNAQYCSDECRFSSYKTTRLGKSNSAYRNGFFTKKRMSSGRRLITKRHMNACVLYRKNFIKEHNYIFCESCGTNNSFKFEVHHIYYASLWPRHPELHNPKNLILVCIQCHNDFHSGIMRSEKFLQIEKERGLKKLFT